jgi:hypothetical protein
MHYGLLKHYLTVNGLNGIDILGLFYFQMHRFSFVELG